MFSEPPFHFCNRTQWFSMIFVKIDQKPKVFLRFFVKIDENRCTIVQNRVSSENRRKSLYYRSKSFKIDENRCTIVQNRSELMKIVVQNRSKSMKIVVLSFKIIQNRWTSLYCCDLPSARPLVRPSARPSALPSARPPVRHPPVRPPVWPSARPPGRGRPNLYT